MSSGGSTPRAPGTPPPIDPLVVGTRFVKQYYSTLLNTPEKVHMFYQNSSLLSSGTGSDPSTALEPDQAKARFQNKNAPFDFDIGAIDAQLSMNGGVLLVVTGSLVEDGTRTNFVHTFFLGSLSSGGKRSFYIHNDILRLLDNDTSISNNNNNNSKPKDEEVPAQSMLLSPDPSLAPVATIEPAPLPSPPVEVKPVGTPVKELTNNNNHVEEQTEPTISTPGNGVEESKEAYETDDDKPPGSWAAMVTRTNKSPAPSPSRPEKHRESHPTTVVIDSAPPKSIPISKPGKRDPDCTLVCKNVDANTTDAQVLELFQPFAKTSGSTIIGISVQAHRGIAFVDYDSPHPVLAAVKHHETEPFVVNGRKLEIYQKTLEQKLRKSAGRGRGRSSRRGGRGRGGRSGR